MHWGVDIRQLGWVSTLRWTLEVVSLVVRTHFFQSLSAEVQTLNFMELAWFLTLCSTIQSMCLLLKLYFFRSFCVQRCRHLVADVTFKHFAEYLKQRACCWNSICFAVSVYRNVDIYLVSGCDFEILCWIFEAVCLLLEQALQSEQKLASF